jgi:Arc/MetJ-type ribon-helix-helix transcriptional regulator
MCWFSLKWRAGVPRWRVYRHFRRASWEGTAQCSGGRWSRQPLKLQLVQKGKAHTPMDGNFLLGVLPLLLHVFAPLSKRGNPSPFPAEPGHSVLTFVQNDGMKIHLRPELEDLIKRDVQRGPYQSVGEFVEDAVSLLHEQEAWLAEFSSEIREKIEQGYAAAQSGELIEVEIGENKEGHDVPAAAGICDIVPLRVMAKGRVSGRRGGGRGRAHGRGPSGGRARDRGPSGGHARRGRARLPNSRRRSAHRHDEGLPSGRPRRAGESNSRDANDSVRQRDTSSHRPRRTRGRGRPGERQRREAGAGHRLRFRQKLERKMQAQPSIAWPKTVLQR